MQKNNFTIKIQKQIFTNKNTKTCHVGENHVTYYMKNGLRRFKVFKKF